MFRSPSYFYYIGYIYTDFLFNLNSSKTCRKDYLHSYGILFSLSEHSLVDQGLVSHFQRTTQKAGLGCSDSLSVIRINIQRDSSEAMGWSWH